MARTKLVILDFEATCDEANPPLPQEIIEFPSVLVDLELQAVTATFTAFVRPVHHPRLRQFCRDLTSIRQADVDAAATFPEVLQQHQAWLAEHDCDDPEDAALVTCGDWDLATMLPGQCAASELSVAALPRIYRQWINLKTVFAAVMGRKAGGMPSMLQALGVPLRGHHHRGIDDCHNLAALALALTDRGATWEITGQLSASRYPPLALTLEWRDQRQSAVLTRRQVASLLGIAGGLFRTTFVAAYLPGSATPLDDSSLTELADGTCLHLQARGESAAGG